MIPQELKTFQHWFSRKIGRKSLTGMPGEKLKETEQFTEPMRVHVYSTAISLRFKNTLKKEFPHTLRVLGDDFDSIVVDYLESHPSLSFTLDGLGRMFAEFLNKDPRVIEKPFVSELAKFERCLHETQFHEGIREISARDLALLSPQRLTDSQLEVNPSLHFLDVNFDFEEFLQSPQMAVPRGAQCSPYMVFHSGGFNYYRKSNAAEKVFLNALKTCPRLKDACEHESVLDYQDELISNLSGWIVQWIDEGIIQGIKIS